jgi:hypothetical protein
MRGHVVGLPRLDPAVDVGDVSGLALSTGPTRPGTASIASGSPPWPRAAAHPRPVVGSRLDTAPPLW